jgi:hypothetical protein
MARLLDCGIRNVSGTLGHHPIVVANGWRTLDAMGWQHAEPVLRYTTRLLGRLKPDRTFTPNLQRVHKTVPDLPTDWASNEYSHEATLEIYKLLREGNADATCDLICSQLSSGKVKAGTMWDAIHLVAADLVFRYKIGGVRIGGSLIHTISSIRQRRLKMPPESTLNGVPISLPHRSTRCTVQKAMRLKLATHDSEARRPTHRRVLGGARMVIRKHLATWYAGTPGSWTRPSP